MTTLPMFFFFNFHLQTCLSVEITSPQINHLVKSGEDAIKLYNGLTFSPQKDSELSNTKTTTIFQGFANAVDRHDSTSGSFQIQLPQLYTGAQVYFMVSATEPSQCCCFHRLDNYLTWSFIRYFGTNENNNNVTYHLYDTCLLKSNLRWIMYDPLQNFYSAHTVSKSHLNLVQQETLKGNVEFGSFNINPTLNNTSAGVLIKQVYNFQIGLSIVTAVNLYCSTDPSSTGTNWYCPESAVDMVRHPQVVKTVAATEMFFSQEGTFEESSGKQNIVLSPVELTQNVLSDIRTLQLGNKSSNCDRLFRTSDCLELDRLDFPKEMGKEPTWSPVRPPWRI